MFKFILITFANKKYSEYFIEEIKTKNETEWAQDGIKLLRTFSTETEENTRVILLFSFTEKEKILEKITKLKFGGMVKYEEILANEANYYPLKNNNYPAFQLRIYSMKDSYSAQKYTDVHWKKHLDSLPKFNIEVEGIYCEESKEGINRVMAIVGYKSREDVEIQNDKYMHSFALLKDMFGFNLFKMGNVEDITMFEQKI